jgi:hypothetical protein
MDVLFQEGERSPEEINGPGLHKDMLTWVDWVQGQDAWDNLIALIP